MVSLPTVAEELEQWRAELDAERLVATFGTGHGSVELVAERGRFSILVDGREVPLEERG